MHRLAILALFITLVLPLACRSQFMWWGPEPLTVHEWGVHSFDWANPTATPPAVPDFMYTRDKPGMAVPRVGERAKDLPVDSGERTKPILYFYLPPAMDSALIGVEVRFAFGNAGAWWPQVNLYRTPGQVANAQPFDVLQWRKAHPFYNEPKLKPPDDERFELVWQRLTLSKTAPPETRLAPALPNPVEHLTPASAFDWVAKARNVKDVAFISNGKEADRFLFYEGQTRETPALAVLPFGGNNNAFPFNNRLGLGEAEPKPAEYYLVNVGDFPLYDVLVIYRDSKHGVRWSQYLPELPAVPTSKDDLRNFGHEVPQIAGVKLPDFTAPAQKAPPADADFQQRLRGLLQDTLTSGAQINPGAPLPRDPAIPQPPTKMSVLFPDEATALLDIWQGDFFRGEGLTVLYRESPAYLDQAMPLQIFTSNANYVLLSRCGLVYNSHIDYAAAIDVANAINTTFDEQDAAKRAQATELLRRQRFLALGLVRYYLRRNASWHGVSREGYAPLLKWLDAGAKDDLPRY